MTDHLAHLTDRPAQETRLSVGVIRAEHTGLPVLPGHARAGPGARPTVRAAADHTQLQHWACGRDRGTTWQLECLDADGEDGGDHDDEDDQDDEQ